MCTRSLLPKYRGAGPIQWAIVRGETRTGVTTMRIDAGLDTGDMLLKAETEIGPEENAIELGRRLAVMGAELLVETLEGLRAGTIVPEKQDDAQATLAPLLKKEDGAIDWTDTAQAIHNRVRGLQPWPGAQTQLSGPAAAFMEDQGARLPGRGTGRRAAGQCEAAGGSLRHGCARTARSTTGRAQANFARRILPTGSA